MSGEIRRATFTDVEVVAQLFDEYRQFSKQPSDLTLATKFISARLVNKDSIIFMAEDINGYGLGFCQLYPTFNSVSATATLVVADLYVTQHARCVGIGRRLMSSAIDYAKAKAISGITLEIREGHSHALALFQSLSFVHKEGFLSYSLDIE
ncbi:GNAT family N-acetyltransferase [Shewanella sp. Isolate11]|uniref:GNAT family N-acetyltransferase n=1 Tax=Shewanella sp. Isolate11 TaxID=2908530 RepID=UPI001EFDB51A|nr:GNAT family N-acetyltransferase [Shewanella sp. Isolate11]MCG9696445.1 GNAT family N-acetyltransferase [Shewanella sp. Isolate11]